MKRIDIPIYSSHLQEAQPLAMTKYNDLTCNACQPTSLVVYNLDPALQSASAVSSRQAGQLPTPRAPMEHQMRSTGAHLNQAAAGLSLYTTAAA